MVTRRITLADVAARAGVSPTTVSFVLNNATAANISAATKDRVLLAAAELRYRPNLAARTLRTKRTLSIGLVSDKIASGTYAVGTIEGAQAAAWEAGYLLGVVNTGGDSEVELRATRALLERQVDGIIFASYATRRVVPPPELEDVATVLVNCFADGSRYRCLLPNECGAAYALAATLLELGHTRIALLSGPAEFWAVAERLRGYRKALGEWGVTLDPSLEATGDWWPETGYALTEQLLDTADPPTAFICGSNRMAFGCHEALRDRGLRVPENASIFGFDNQEFAAHMRPALGSVRLPDFEMASRAVGLILESTSSVSAGTELFECEILLRNSHAEAPPN